MVAAEDWDTTEWEKSIDMMDIKQPRNDERPKRYSNPIFLLWEIQRDSSMIRRLDRRTHRSRLLDVSDDNSAGRSA